MAVPDEAAREVLVKCGRCCCLCRRFLPIRLQVHHIVPPGEGGTDEVDNLIALCMTCHTDVHTNTPFTRRFSAEELKMHRERLYELVADGKLPSATTRGDLLEMLPDGIPTGFSELTLEHSIPSLTSPAIKVLTAAAFADGIVIMAGNGVQAGKRKLVQRGDARCYAEYRYAVQQLEESELLEDRRGEGSVYFVTHKGYLLADELAAAGRQGCE